MSVDVGSTAPDFTLTNHDRQPVTLSAQRGKPVVLAFFPAAFSSVCAKELCTFRDSFAKLGQAEAQVYGISVDTFFTLKAFHDQQKLSFPLLSDFSADVTYHVTVGNARAATAGNHSDNPFGNVKLDATKVASDVLSPATGDELLA